MDRLLIHVLTLHVCDALTLYMLTVYLTYMYTY